MRVAELLEKYFPADSILHRMPNYKFNNHFIIHDNFMGFITTTNTNDYKQNYDHVDIHTREDILAMNVDKNMFTQYTEKDVASFIHNLINDLPQYTPHQI